MEDYPDLDWQAEAAERRLRLVAMLTTRDADTTAQEVARACGYSRQHAYILARKARDALTDATPGPRPHQQDPQHLRRIIDELAKDNDDLRSENHRLRLRLEEAVFVDERRQQKLNLVCLGEHVSLRATQQIMAVAWGKKHTQSRSAIANERAKQDAAARRIIDDARIQVKDNIRCVMGDDVYFHQQAIKVVAEPDSGAILNLGRWTGSSGADWALWLEDYPNLTILVSDLAKDLVGAGTRRSLAHSADLFHEVRWFKDKILKPLEKAEAKLEAAYLAALDAATRPRGPGRRLSAAKVAAAWASWDQAETDYLVMAEMIDEIRSLYEPLCPQTGRLWTQTEQAALLADLLARLAAWDHPIARRARKHLKSHQHRYTAWRVRFVELAKQVDSTSWSGMSVLNGLIRLRQLSAMLADPSIWTDYASYLERQRLHQQLQHRLRRACRNLDEIESLLARELGCVRRSSSGVESFNSRLRVAQYTHRHITDDHLALLALKWNLCRRPADRRIAGQSPYDILGVDIGQGDKPWFDVLLDAD